MIPPFYYLNIPTTYGTERTKKDIIVTSNTRSTKRIEEAGINEKNNQYKLSR